MHKGKQLDVSWGPPGASCDTTSATTDSSKVDAAGGVIERLMWPPKRSPDADESSSVVLVSDAALLRR